MAEKLRLKFAFPPPELSPNARGHWAMKAEAVRQYRFDCAMDARDQANGTSLTSPVTAQVTFILPNWRRRDLDNLAASIKPLWDGIVDAGVLSDDSTAVINEKGYRARVEKGERAVLVTLEES